MKYHWKYHWNAVTLETPTYDLKNSNKIVKMNYRTGKTYTEYALELNVRQTDR
jgi:hypothetical protein